MKRASERTDYRGALRIAQSIDPDLDWEQSGEYDPTEWVSSHPLSLANAESLVDKLVAAGYDADAYPIRAGRGKHANIIVTLHRGRSGGLGSAGHYTYRKRRFVDGVQVLEDWIMSRDYEYLEPDEVFIVHDHHGPGEDAWRIFVWREGTATFEATAFQLGKPSYASEREAVAKAKQMSSTA